MYLELLLLPEALHPLHELGKPLLVQFLGALHLPEAPEHLLHLLVLLEQLAHVVHALPAPLRDALHALP